MELPGSLVETAGQNCKEAAAMTVIIINILLAAAVILCLAQDYVNKNG